MTNYPPGIDQMRLKVRALQDLMSQQKEMCYGFPRNALISWGLDLEQIMLALNRWKDTPTCTDCGQPL